jgi:hypothetical protein
VESRFEALAVTYVFLLAILSPVLVRIADPLTESLLRRSSPEKTVPGAT